MGDINWDAIGQQIERNVLGARAWTFRPTATVEREEDGTFTITLDWSDSYEMAWDQSWNEMEDKDQHGANVLDRFLNEQPEHEGKLASHWSPSEEEPKEEFACDVCGRTFNTKRGLGSHYGQMHK